MSCDSIVATGRDEHKDSGHRGQSRASLVVETARPRPTLHSFDRLHLLELPSSPIRTRSSTLKSAITLLRCSLLLACRGAPPRSPSPAPFILHTDVVELNGHRVHVDVYEPAAEPSDGVAIVAHGFTRSRARHRDLGEALAAAGVTAVIPDLPYILNHWGNGDAIEELARKLETGALGLPPIDQSRLVLTGTSAGGLATVLAAAKLPHLAGWVGWILSTGQAAEFTPLRS